MPVAIDSLGLKHLWIVYPGSQSFPIDKRITAWPLNELARLPDELS
jgi:hypothetical protein